MGKVIVEVDTETKAVRVLQLDQVPVAPVMVAKGCENCHWDRYGYCEEPNGNSCNWQGELFRGEKNNWTYWKEKAKR